MPIAQLQSLYFKEKNCEVSENHLNWCGIENMVLCPLWLDQSTETTHSLDTWSLAESTYKYTSREYVIGALGVVEQANFWVDALLKHHTTLIKPKDKISMIKEDGGKLPI